MYEREWRIAAAGLAALHAGNIMFGAGLSYTGTAAVAALFALVLAQGAGRALQAGFAAFTLLALDVELRSGGYGWPDNLGVAPEGYLRVLEGGLLVIGLAGAATAAVRRPGRRLWRVLPAIAALSLAVAGVLASWSSSSADSADVDGLWYGAEGAYIQPYYAPATEPAGVFLQPGIRNEAAIEAVVVEDDLWAVPTPRSWSFDPFNGGRFSWEATLQATPAMVVLLVSALVANLAWRPETA